MDDSILYSNPEWEKELKEHAKEFNKFNFYDEIDKISGTDLSEEMRLVCEFNLRFQWVEYKVKELLWVLYGATSIERDNIYLNINKKHLISKMNTRSLCEELLLFSINEDGYRETLGDISKSLLSISQVRNPITHALFSEKIREKEAMIMQLKNRINQLKSLEKKVEEITVPIMSIAAQVEIASKLAQRVKSEAE